MLFLLNIFTILSDEGMRFLGIGPLIDMYKSGDYSSLHTLQGIENAIGPLIPFLLLIEIIRSAFYKRFHVLHYKVQFFTYVFNSFIGRFISIAMVIFCVGLFEKFAIIKTTFTWYWLIYGYIIWELSHF